MNKWFVIFYSEGPGTSRYECARFRTPETCQDFIRRYDHPLAQWEVVEESQ